MIVNILSAAGATLIITSSKIFQPAREFITKHSIWGGELIGCDMCVGFWVGLGASFITGEKWFTCFLVSVVSYFLGLLAFKLKK